MTDLIQRKPSIVRGMALASTALSTASQPHDIYEEPPVRAAALRASQEVG